MIRFVNSQSLAVAFCSLLLTACGQVQQAEPEPLVNQNRSVLETQVSIAESEAVPVAAPKAAKSLIDSLDFLPQPQSQTAGSVGYQALANPYEAQEGAIAKESIGQFIAIRRALKSEQHEQARSLLLALTESDATLSGPWVLLADGYRREGKQQQAIEAYQQGLAINSLNVNGYIGLAISQRVEGDFIAAQHTYVKALTVWPDFPEAHLNIAILYDQYLNKPLKAQRHFEAYLYLAAEQDEQAVQWLAELQQRTGQALVLQRQAVTVVAEN
ncbi:hypothetical protein SIN8267_02651 [Sinobacterium norvegicum]|uniref:Tetratricopeptide repeat protein n=1 Tax=Sinobacterium norvegicum TaxID=1641715 RepID=A0ABM9AID3_9GAMM|nr:hypothetical protein [Sinobacterium norvegicum]CAH0992519.1 hypothetical protein SIN8267_02651 [Sinobacterium norvegicum]